jgi:purine-binding chemotaxis protein CheW
MSDWVQLCVLSVGGQSYLVDIRRVDEILTAPKVTPLARAPKFLEGVVRLRGEVLPVVDVRRRLGVQPAVAPRRKEKLVVCRLGRRRVGLMVDAVTQVLRVQRSSLKPAPLAGGPGFTPFVLGVWGEGEQLKLMLDVKALVLEDA